MFDWLIQNRDDGEAAALLTYGSTNVIDVIDEYKENHDIYDDKEIRKILSFYKKHRLIKKFKLKIKNINPQIGLRSFNLKVEM